MSSHATNSNDFHAEHITPVSTYVKTYLVLMGFMVLTIAAARLPYLEAAAFLRSPIGSVLNNVVALTIAIVKAVIVVAIFMGLRYSSKLVRLYAVMGFVWFLLLFIVFADYGTRQWEPVRGWEPVAPGAMPRFRSGPTPELQGLPTAPNLPPNQQQEMGSGMSLEP